MKSSLLWALALVSFASAARADESSLSLYGVIDAGLIHQRVTGPQGVRTSHTGMVSGGLSYDVEESPRTIRNLCQKVQERTLTF